MMSDTVDQVKEALVYEKSSALSKATQQSSAFCRVINGHSSPQVNPSSSMLMSSNSLHMSSHSVDRSVMASTLKDKADGKRHLTNISQDKLDEIWQRSIAKCHSKTLRQLLSNYGKLISISENEGVPIVDIVFGNENIKSRAERFFSSITDSMEIVLGCNVEVRIGYLPDNQIKGTGGVPDSSAGGKTGIIGLLDKERKRNPNNSSFSSNKDSHKELLNLPRKSVDHSEGKPQILDICESCHGPNGNVEVPGLPIFSSKENGVCGTKEKWREVPMQRLPTSAIDEQRLESAWLQALEKGTSELVNSSKHERNQILPQSGNSHQTQNEPMMALSISSKHWEDELNQEIKALKNTGSQDHKKEQIGGRVGHHAISPSLLHSNSSRTNFDQENKGYESGSGCNGLLCWKASKHHRGKARKGTRVRVQKIGRLLCLGHRGKSKVTTESGSRG